MIPDGNPPTEYRIFMIVEGVYLPISDLSSDITVLYRLPLFSSSETVKNITLCVKAIDFEEAYT